jgi:hypothetical protein
LFWKFLFLRINSKDGNEIIEEDELDGFVKDLMDLIKKVYSILTTRSISIVFVYIGL